MSAVGRVNQRKRTRKDLLEAALRVSAEGKTPTLDEIADDAALPPDLLTDDEQTRSLLEQAMQTLPLEQREVLALWMQGVELVEVAGLTGVPWATLVSRKKYGLRKIRVFLERAGVRRSSDVIA